MKTKKLLKKVKGLLDGEERKKKKEIDALVKLVKKLKAKEKEIKKKMDCAESGGQRTKLAKRVAMVRLQLEKGKTIIKTAIKERKAAKAGEEKECEEKKPVKKVKEKPPKAPDTKKDGEDEGDEEEDS